MDPKEAIEQIQIIRNTMKKATQRFFFSPWQWIEWGIIVIIAGLLTMRMMSTNKTEHLLMLWIAALIIGGILEGLVWLLDAKHRGYDPFSPLYVKIWGTFTCFLLPATIFTLVFVQINQPLYIVGLWLITAASAMFTLVIFGDRKELVLFGLFMLIGGILSVSILVEKALLVGVACFGVGGLLMGIYLLIKDIKTFHEESK